MFRRRRTKLILGVVGSTLFVWYFTGFEGGQSNSRSNSQRSASVPRAMTGEHNASGGYGDNRVGVITVQDLKNQVLPKRIQDEAEKQEVRKIHTAMMSRRREQVFAHCPNNTRNSRYLTSKIPIINRRHHYLHCPLTKAASTFWSRFALTLNTSGSMLSPFSYHLANDAPLPTSRFADLSNAQDRSQFLQHSVKTLFVREPYYRMFSAYVDKILGPNPYYWKEWGQTGRRLKGGAAQRARNSVICHQDLTFPQVMALAAASFHKHELHFVPASVRCQPCEFRYDVIGKMETFSQDLNHLSQLMNLSLTDYFSSQQFRLDYVKDAIEDSVNSPFGWEKQIGLCISRHHMGLRIWRKLQIRGLIDRRIPFPYSPEQFQAVTASQLIDVAMEAHLNSTDRAHLQRQKREAFVEAYRTVDLQVLYKLREVFHDDFLMFGYDSSPRDVFDRQSALNSTGALDCYAEW